MEDRRETPDLGELDQKLGELERLADSLDAVPDEGLVEALDRAVELLREINERIEMGIDAAAEESREVGAVIERLDLGAFDETLEELERQERTSGEP